MFRSIGQLKYSYDPYKLIVSVDQGIGDFYRSLIPKAHQAQKPLYPSHISVVRNEIPDSSANYQDQDVEFIYEPYIYNDETYYWLNCFSPHLECIRLELGLPITSQYTRSPDGLHKFHMTLANIKHLK
jgi:hypothetical protein